MHAPPPVSPHRAQASERARAITRLLDTLFRVPGTRIRFGLDPLLGLIPGVGDVAGTVLSSYIIAEAIRAGASGPVLARMVLNMGIDTLVSAIPFLGDLFDVGWRANSRNLGLLQGHLADPQRTTAASRAFVAGVLVAVAGLIIGTAYLALVMLGVVADLLNRLAGV
jgi:hypothetical protein